MNRDRHVTWTSKTRLSELEGYILSVYVRLQATGLARMKDRQVVPPTLLTAEIAERVVGPYAFTMDAVFSSKVKTIKQVDNYMAMPGKGDEVGAWVHDDANQNKIEKARKRLAELTGDFRCVG